MGTSEELLQSCKAAMGDSLGELFFHLDQEFARLHLKWKEFCLLYDDEEHVQILNVTAPAFFGRLQQMWWESIFLHLTRMTDPPAFRDHKRLTVRWLPEEISETDPDLGKKVSDLVEKAITATAFARDWRDRRLAHRDLGLIKDPDSRPLKSATKKKVEDALDALEAVLHKVELEYRNAETWYRGIVTGIKGVHSLLHILRIGRDAQQSE